MIRRRCVWWMLGFVIALACAGSAADQWAIPVQPANAAIWMFNNTVGAPVTGLRLEFDEPVVVTYYAGIGGDPVLALSTETTFDFVGDVVAGGTFSVEWTPLTAVPSLAMWMSGQLPVGAPFFTTVAKMGYLFGRGIVYLRETDPAGLAAAFDQFFADNAEYLATLSASLGMSLADSLMPIIMSSPAEGIENFFTTIITMLGVTTLEEVVAGGINFSALFVALGL